VYGFLDSRHVFVLVHVVLDIGLLSLRLFRAWALSGEVSRAIAVVTLSDSLGSWTALEGFFYLSEVSSKALLVRPVWGKASSGEVHWNGDIVHGPWGIRGIELWWPRVVVEPLWRAIIESLQGSEDRGVCARSHRSEELSGLDHCNGLIFQVLVVGGDFLDYLLHNVWSRLEPFEEVVHRFSASYRVACLSD